MKNNNRGDGGLTIFLLIAVLGACGFIAFKPKALDKASKTAAASVTATTNLNAAHEEEVKALKAKSASAAAGVAVITQVAGTLPDTPTRSAIVSEASIVQSKQEAPDPVEQLAAERRANAILTGNLEESRRLNALAYQDSASMRDRTIAAEAGRTKAEAQRDAIDTQLKESAAASLAAQNANNRWKLAVLASGPKLRTFPSAPWLKPLRASKRGKADLKPLMVSRPVSNRSSPVSGPLFSIHPANLNPFL